MTMRTFSTLTRREALVLAGGAALAAMLPGSWSEAVAAGASPLLMRSIPRTGEKLSVIGLGTSQVFDFDLADAAVHAERRAVLEKMLAGGATLIDTAPSYGSAEGNVGALLEEIKARDRFFIATKVGVKATAAETLAEMQQSQQRLRTQRSDLLQLHNVRSASTDLGALREWQKAGNTRYIGITHWQDSAHDLLVELMQKQKPDFVQVNYSLDARAAEDVVLPAARDLGIAVLTNVPFGRNRLFRAVRGKEVPAFAKDFGATSWAQVFLKFILANDAVTCVIPGTDKPQYMVENIAAGSGAVPMSAQRKQILDYWSSLA
ncbi:MAG: aldo/keto reductase [Steroidobacteraceae bacterium]